MDIVERIDLLDDLTGQRFDSRGSSGRADQAKLLAAADAIRDAIAREIVAARAVFPISVVTRQGEILRGRMVDAVDELRRLLSGLTPSRLAWGVRLPREAAYEALDAIRVTAVEEARSPRARERAVP